LPTVTLPSTTVRQWRSLIACRQTWLGWRGMYPRHPTA
jgi:hypothetical protein